MAGSSAEVELRCLGCEFRIQNARRLEFRDAVHEHITPPLSHHVVLYEWTE